MKLNQAISEYLNYHRTNSKGTTMRTYAPLFKLFGGYFNDRDVESIRPDEIQQFMESTTTKCCQNTKGMRLRMLKTYFNFCINILCIDLKNPCSTPLLKKTYQIKRLIPKSIISKEALDEIIYRTESERDRLLLEIQSRSGLRVGEALKLCPADIDGRKITIRMPKSRKPFEYAFLPTPLAERLNRYIKESQISPDKRIFNFCYMTALNIVRRAGNRSGAKLRPHDLRRHSATYASRNGVPLEVVSKVILRHQNLQTTQIYLGTISNEEALRWVDTLHNK